MVPHSEGVCRYSLGVMLGWGAIGMDMGHHGQHPHMVKCGEVEISMYSLSVS